MQHHAVNNHLPRIHIIQPRQAVKHGSLAAAAGAHNGDHLAPLDRQVDAPQGVHLDLPGVISLVDCQGFHDGRFIYGLIGYGLIGHRSLRRI